METNLPKVLIVDDNPRHLEIYAMVVEQANCKPIPVMVKFSGPDYPPDTDISLIVLDYRLNSVTTAPEIAEEAQRRYPRAPVILLSDLWAMPKDVAPFVARFIRKGEPQELIDTIQVLVGQPEGTQV
jgi:CheY-like chemotaxis protein